MNQDLPKGVIFGKGQLGKIKQLRSLCCSFTPHGGSLLQLLLRTTLYDITLLKEISWYEENVNALVGKLAWKALSHHLWYVVEKIMPLSLFSDAFTNKEKEEIVEKLKSIEDSSSFSNRQGNGFGRPNFPTLLNKDVGVRTFLYFVAYLSSYHEKAINAL